MFSVKIEKFLCLCRNEMCCLLLYEAMFTRVLLKALDLKIFLPTKNPVRPLQL